MRKYIDKLFLLLGYVPRMDPGKQVIIDARKFEVMIFTGRKGLSRYNLFNLKSDEHREHYIYSVKRDIANELIEKLIDTPSLWYKINNPVYDGEEIMFRVRVIIPKQ